MQRDIRVLVVDDMSSMRMMIKAVLRDMGIVSIKDASDGEKALEILRVQSFDLVICDWDMPKLDGFELLRQVRAGEAGARLPFIMLTAISARDAVARAIEAGVSDYLAKPFKPIDLVTKIQRLLS